MKTLVSLSVAMTAAACTVGPNYDPPRPDTPPAFQEVSPPDQTPLSRIVATPTDLTHWWEQFHDLELESLIGRALSGNLDLQTASSRIRLARQQVVVQGAA